jgi:hypothetical protein
MRFRAGDFQGSPTTRRRVLARGPLPVLPFSDVDGQRTALASRGVRRHAFGMFVVTEADAAAIRAAFDRGGEFSAAVELRRRFPGIADTAQAGDCARTIAAWKPSAVPLRRVRLPRERR